MRIPYEMAIGPAHLIHAGAHAAVVRLSGIVLEVFDMAGDCRGVFASWAATRTAVFALVVEWEAGVDLSRA